MGWKNLDDLHAYQRRRSARYAEVGRQLEDDVEKLLGEMKAAGEITGFFHHPPCSPADRDGRDFSVSQKIGDLTVTRTFGITISPRRAGQSRARHPEVPLFCFPIGTGKPTQRKRILELFQQPSR